MPTFSHAIAQTTHRDVIVILAPAKHVHAVPIVSVIRKVNSSAIVKSSTLKPKSSIFGFGFFKCMHQSIVISGMVCQRCVMVVQGILEQLKLPYVAVQVGQILPERDYTAEERSSLEKALKNVGFEIVTGRQEQLITNIKNRVRKYLDTLSAEELPNLSEYITQEIFYDYSYLSDLFSSAENKTIEQYFIELRIDKVKEQLVYTQKSLSDIAFDLGFSSPQHFANQFKQHTGQSPSAFIKMHALKR